MAYDIVQVCSEWNCKGHWESTVHTGQTVNSWIFEMSLQSISSWDKMIVWRAQTSHDGKSLTGSILGNKHKIKICGKGGKWG